MPGMCCLALPSPASCSSRSSCQAGPEGPWAGKEQQETRKALRYFFIMNYIPGIVAPLAVGAAVEGVSGVMGTVQFSKLGFFPLYLQDQFCFTAAPSGGFTLTVFISFNFPEGLCCVVSCPLLSPSPFSGACNRACQGSGDGSRQQAGPSARLELEPVVQTGMSSLSCGFMVKVGRAPRKDL